MYHTNRIIVLEQGEFTLVKGTLLISLCEQKDGLCGNKRGEYFFGTPSGVCFFNTKENEMKDTIRRQRLHQLAEQDSIYLSWKSSFENTSEKFHDFAMQCPEDVRSFLYGYAVFGRMMMQRMLNLACSYMEFPDEKQ